MQQINSRSGGRLLLYLKSLFPLRIPALPHTLLLPNTAGSAPGWICIDFFTTLTH